jgi:pimeloyl-ACP methyl ester carboxylesterase
VIAFDHPTIADDPITNGRTFLETVGDRTLELDIVCHSRGGLVSRAIAERPGDLARLAPNVRVRSIVLVGVPSNGTILADAEHWNELVDRVTTLVGLVPMPGAVETLETVFALVRSIAVRTAVNLKGLEAMAPGSDFLATLNVATPDAGRYRAIVSDFEPKNPGWKEWLNDAVRDRIFGEGANDMMVAIASMDGENGSSRFPVTDISSFGPADAVEHSDYFWQQRSQEALLRWLTG